MGCCHAVWCGDSGALRWPRSSPSELSVGNSQTAGASKRQNTRQRHQRRRQRRPAGQALRRPPGEGAQAFQPQEAQAGRITRQICSAACASGQSSEQGVVLRPSHLRMHCSGQSANAQRDRTAATFAAEMKTLSGAPRGIQLLWGLRRCWQRQASRRGGQRSSSFFPGR